MKFQQEINHRAVSITNLMLSLFQNRIDGIMINVTNNFSEPIKIDNGSVLMHGHVQSTHKDEDSSVVLLSLQYESGKYASLFQVVYFNIPNF